MNHEDRTIAVRQDIPTPRIVPHHDQIGPQLACGPEDLFAGVPEPDQVTRVDSGCTRSIHNSLQLGWNRAVRIPRMRWMLAGKDVQRHELRVLLCGDCDGTVDRGPIQWPSIGGKQHDPQRSRKPRAR